MLKSGSQPRTRYPAAASSPSRTPPCSPVSDRRHASNVLEQMPAKHKILFHRPAPVSPHVCRQRCAAMSARRDPAVPLVPRMHYPAAAGRGPAPGGPVAARLSGNVCRQRCVATARRARSVPPARRACPPRLRPAEGSHPCVPQAVRRDRETSTLRAARASESRLPTPCTASRGPAPGGPLV